jgi:tetratricopeptide (TPR) repeat protein
MKRIGLAAGALTLVATLATPGVAQQRNRALVATEPGRMMIPLCQLRAGGKVNDGQKELRTGIEDKDAAKRAAALGKAEQILTQAVQGADAANPAAWYYLGRTYLAAGDVRGADSAFTKVVGMVPDCELDIDQYRQNAWATLANAGIQRQQQGQTDSAMALFREANQIFRKLPHVFENMGVVFANAGQNDSAAAYFAEALVAAEGDTTYMDNRNSSALNLVLMHQRLGRHQEAIGVLRRYLEWKPGDTDARRSLAYSFREMGHTDSAETVERQLVEEFSAMNLDSLSSADLMAVGVTQFNNKVYDKAAEIFRRLMTRNPWSRDAVFNLANTYLALKENDSLIVTSRQLLQIEPMNEDAYRLLGSAFRELKQQDSLVATAEKLVSLPVNVEVTQFSIRSSGARWTATATGREATDPGGRPVPPAPLTLVVEFLTEAGAVVASEEVSIPALATAATHQLQVDGAGETIAAWRYRRK